MIRFLKRHPAFDLWLFAFQYTINPLFIEPKNDFTKTIYGIMMLIFLGGFYFVFAAIVGALQNLTLRGIGKELNQKKKK
ncbi:MAG: hypothetical protein D6720_02600 [Gammaproteobacteria bacterium]|nr:MAG: hypothetical protein D6720_02600 [Gammaproteobacteria bacterium]